jgi:hypothetical protein
VQWRQDLDSVISWVGQVTEIFEYFRWLMMTLPQEDMVCHVGRAVYEWDSAPTGCWREPLE